MWQYDIAEGTGNPFFPLAAIDIFCGVSVVIRKFKVEKTTKIVQAYFLAG